MTTPPIRPETVAPLASKQATIRPDARLMRLPERLSAYMQSRSQTDQVYLSDQIMSMETEIKSLTMAIQYASRATSLIQETEQQTGELLNLVNQIRSMARKMTLPDIRDTDRKKTETQINKLWGEVSKITSPDVVDSLNDPMPMSRPSGSALTDKQKALSNLDKAAAQLELQRDALAETSAGVMETIDILTRTASANIMTSKNPSLKASIDHVEKSAAMMAERAQTTKAAQKQAASALFTQILHLI